MAQGPGRCHSQTTHAAIIIFLIYTLCSIDPKVKSKAKIKGNTGTARSRPQGLCGRMATALYRWITNNMHWNRQVLSRLSSVI